MRHHKNLAAQGAETSIGFFLLKRFASLLATLLAASVVVFAVLDVLPGNAAEVMLGDERDAGIGGRALGQARPRPAGAGALRRLDGGPGDRRARHQHRLRHADRELIGERLRVTVPLALMAMALTTVLALRRSASSPRRATAASATSA